MMSKIKRFITASPIERRALIQSLFLLPAVKVSLAFSGFRRTLGRLSTLGVSQCKVPKASLPIEGIVNHGQVVAKMVEVAANILPFEIKCLPISMVTWLLLQRRGVSSELRIGVKRFDDDFEAHAWIEVAGFPLHQRTDQSSQFTPFSTPITPQI